MSFYREQQLKEWVAYFKVRGIIRIKLQNFSNIFFSNNNTQLPLWYIVLYNLDVLVIFIFSSVIYLFHMRFSLGALGLWSISYKHDILRCDANLSELRVREWRLFRKHRTSIEGQMYVEFTSCVYGDILVWLTMLLRLLEGGVYFRPSPVLIRENTVYKFM